VSVDRPDDNDARRESADAPEVPGDAADRAEPEVAGQPTEQAARLQAHAELRVNAADAYRAYAIDQGCDRVREIEETVTTPAMRRIEAEDPSRVLVGLEFRLKGRERLAEKVAFDMTKKGITADEAFAGVKDAIRYTLEYPEDEYASGVYADCDRLASEGFELVERRNSWTKEEYKGINSRWRALENRQVFEVQFHTQASFEAKQATHWAYERLRSGVPPQEQRRLDQFQRDVSARIPIPPSAPDIPDYP
jgi:hypothetical protein